VEDGASIDLSGKKVYAPKRSTSVVSPASWSQGSDKRLDRDRGGLLPVQGRPEPDKPKHRPGLQGPPSDSLAEAIRLRRIISDTRSDHAKRE